MRTKFDIYVFIPPISTKTNNYPSPSLSGTTIYDVGNPGPDLGTWLGTGTNMYKCLDSVDTTDEWGTLKSLALHKSGLLSRRNVFSFFLCSRLKAFNILHERKHKMMFMLYYFTFRR